MEFISDPQMQQLAKRRDELENELKAVKQQLTARHNELWNARFGERIEDTGMKVHYSMAVIVNEPFMNYTKDYFGYVDIKLNDTLYLLDYYPEYGTFELATYNPYESSSGTVIPGIPTEIVQRMTPA